MGDSCMFKHTSNTHQCLLPHLNKAGRFGSSQVTLSYHKHTQLRTSGIKQQSPTWSKVHCCIKTLESPTLQVKLACTISCEEHNLIPKMQAKELQKETQIVVVASEVASILVLYLQSKSKSVRPQPIQSASDNKTRKHKSNPLPPLIAMLKVSF